MNHVVLVGRLAEDPRVTTTESGKQVTTVSVAVTRNFKNTEGIYESDFIRCVLWNGVATNTSEYCQVGDVIGIKGRLQTRYYDDEDNKRIYVMEVIAEKVTFLSSSKNKEVKDAKSSKKSKKEGN